MDVRHLRYFVAVATERSFSRAAEKLHIAQPPLSRQIRQLEEELGVRLIDREKRPLTLTAAGRLLLEQAHRVLDDMHGLKTMMQRFAQAGRSLFTVGFVPSVMYAGLPPLIRDFRSSEPDIELRLIEMMSYEQVTALKEGRIDIGFGRLRLEDEAISRRVLVEEPLVLALSPAHRLATSAANIALEAVSEETLIVYPRNPRPSYADQVLSLLRDRGLKPAAIHESSELQTALGLVAAEVGCCIVPTSVQRLRRDDVVYRDLTPSNLTSPIIVSHRFADKSAALLTMQDLVAATWR